MALLSYCTFADESVKDMTTAIEMWPSIKKAQKGNHVKRIMLSCFLRFLQGLMAILVALLMIVTTADVIDIILNFTAVNFISAFGT